MGPVVVVRLDTSVREVASLMLAQRAQGVLVVDDHAEVVGVVTERQLTLDGHYLRLACTEVPEIDGRWVTALQEVDAACIAARTLTARDVMDRRLTSACTDEPLGAVVERLLCRDADYAVIHEGDTVVGILGGHELLLKLAGEACTARPQADALHVNGQRVHVGMQGQRRPLIRWLLGSTK
jgi:CBS domain-containing protein